jgi:hypothetical protein
MPMTAAPTMKRVARVALADSPTWSRCPSYCYLRMRRSRLALTGRYATESREAIVAAG